MDEEPQTDDRRRRKKSHSDNAPSYQTYWRDIQADRRYRRLTYDQRGRYRDWLDLTHGTKHPGVTTEVDLFNELGYGAAEWAKNRSAFEPLFKVRGEVWTQSRTKKEADARKRRFKFSRKNGKDGADKRWGGNNMNRVAKSGAINRGHPKNVPLSSSSSSSASGVGVGSFSDSRDSVLVGDRATSHRGGPVRIGEAAGAALQTALSRSRIRDGKGH